MLYLSNRLAISIFAVASIIFYPTYFHTTHTLRTVLFRHFILISGYICQRPQFISLCTTYRDLSWPTFSAMCFNRLWVEAQFCIVGPIPLVNWINAEEPHPPSILFITENMGPLKGTSHFCRGSMVQNPWQWCRRPLAAAVLFKFGTARVPWVWRYWKSLRSVKRPKLHRQLMGQNLRPPKNTDVSLLLALTY